MLRLHPSLNSRSGCVPLAWFQHFLSLRDAPAPSPVLRPPHANRLIPRVPMAPAVVKTAIRVPVAEPVVIAILTVAEAETHAEVGSRPTVFIVVSRLSHARG